MKSYFFTSYAATYRKLSVTSVLPEANNAVKLLHNVLNAQTQSKGATG